MVGRMRKAIGSYSTSLFLCFLLGYQAISEVSAQETSQTEIESEATQEPPSASETSSLSDEQPQDGTPLMQATDWLSRLAKQVNLLSFESVFVVTSSGKDAMPYVWRRATINDGHRIEQLSLLNGPGFEQIAHLGKVSVFEPGFPAYSVKGKHVQSPIPDGFIYNPEAISDGYDAIVMGRNRIAGRMAQQIRVVSKDKTRFGYHLWMDEESGLLLKLNTYNLEGKLIEQLQVTQLNISNDLDQLFANFNPDQMPENQLPFSHEQTDLAWDISFLPVGMDILKKSLHRIQRTGQLAEYMLLSDGVVDVSVYLIEANPAFNQKSSWHSGQNAVVARSDGTVQVTVLGKIPEKTANLIADSIIAVEETQ